MFAYSTPRAPPNGHAHTGRIDIRDRVKAYAVLEDAENSQAAITSDNLSPTDAFFGQASRFPSHAPITRVQKRRYPQQEVEKSRKRQQLPPSQHQPYSNGYQPAYSPAAQNLIDQIKAEGDKLYNGALGSMSTVHEALDQILTDTAAENDSILASIDSDAKKIAKPLSEMMISDDESGGTTRVGESVATFKADVDFLEAEVGSLWDQWQAAEKDVHDMFAELAGKEGDESGGRAGLVTTVKESLAREICNFEEDLDGVLEDAHEKLRTMEKNMSKKINNIVKSLVQQSMLE